MKKLKKLSKISTLHYIRLLFRSVLFVAALIAYIIKKINSKGGSLLGENGKITILHMVIWVIFAIEMVLRFFPSSLESMGCQKQFSKNFIPTSVMKSKEKTGKTTFAVFIAWIALNSIIGGLYIAKMIDEGILLLICLAYSVCDMICILFFCPFQAWFMKNKCCGSCRIYNWDYAMMFTPLLFIKSLYTWSLLALSLGLLLKWEIIHLFHPERFSEKTNASLTCANCQEKLCSHKKSLQKFLKLQKH